jgi:hypothetical protein
VLSPSESPPLPTIVPAKTSFARDKLNVFEPSNTVPAPVSCLYSNVAVGADRSMVVPAGTSSVAKTGPSKTTHAQTGTDTEESEGNGPESGSRPVIAAMLFSGVRGPE